MSIRTDNVVLSVQINGNAAQNQLNELKKKAADLTHELAGMKQGTQDFINKSAEIAKVDAEMAGLREQIGLTKLSIRELASARKQLTAILNATVPGSAEFKKFAAELELVIARQKELKDATQGFKSVAQTSFSSIKQNIGSLVASYIGFYAVIGGIKSVFSNAVKLSDQLGDLRRVAGLTSKEATDLNHALLQIDTRTSGAGLLSIAIIAGKLGVAKDDIFSFTQAVDKLVVTLGDELGGADEITTQLGKILNVFDGKVTGDNISFLGNAIVDLANKGVATGGYIVDFTQRVAGIAKASNISLGATVGLAAGFESLGLRSESSSTALQKLILSISQDIPKAAKIAGMSAKDFNQLFADQPQEALLKYTEGLVKNKKAFSEITSSFKDAGETGARVVQTILAIGQNADFMRGQINQGNESIKEQTALNEGFAIKNENLAGSIDRLGKAFDRLVANNRVTSFLQGIVNVLSGALEGVNALIDSFDSLDERRAKELKKQDENQNAFAQNVVNGSPATANDPGVIGMKDLTLEEQHKLADSYKAIYIASRQQLADFMNSSDKDNLVRLKNLRLQVEQDGKIFIATQKKLKESLAPASNKINATTDTPSPTSSGSDSKNSEYNSLLKDYKKFLQDLADLKKKSDNSKLSDSDREVQEVQDKYNELLTRAAIFHAKLHTLESTYDAQTKQLVQAKLDEIAAIRKKYFEQNSADEYAQSIKASDDYFAEQKRNLEREYAEGKVSKDEYENSLTDIEARAIKNRIVIAKDYSSAVKKASEDVKTFSISQEDFITKNLQKQKDLRVAFLQDEVNATREIRNMQINNPDTSIKQRASLQKENAKDDKDDAIQKLKDSLKAQGKAYDDASVAMTKQGKAIWTNYYDTIKNIDDNTLKSQIENIANYAALLNEGLNSINTILTNSENRQAQKEQAANDRKTKALKKQLDNKLISQKQYDLAIEKMQEDADKKDKKRKHDQAVRQKALDIFAAVINTARAVAEALPNVFLAAAVGALGALQIAAIATAPVPEAADGNWFRKGDKHKDPSGGIPVMIERDEAVIKADAMTDNKTYTVTGTPAQITSKLNSIHGGVNWASGAIVQPKFMERPSPINSNLPMIMAMGGVAYSTKKENLNDTVSNHAFNEVANDRFNQVNDKFDKIIEVFERKQDALHAVVSIREYREMEKKYDNAKKASGMSQ